MKRNVEEIKVLERVCVTAGLLSCYLHCQSNLYMYRLNMHRGTFFSNPVVSERPWRASHPWWFDLLKAATARQGGWYESILAGFWRCYQGLFIRLFKKKKKKSNLSRRGSSRARGAPRIPSCHRVHVWEFHSSPYDSCRSPVNWGWRRAITPPAQRRLRWPEKTRAGNRRWYVVDGSDDDLKGTSPLWLLTTGSPISQTYFMSWH